MNFSLKGMASINERFKKPSSCFLILLTVLLTGLQSATFSQSVTWTGNRSTAWDTRNNWQSDVPGPNNVPRENTDVTIPEVNSNNPVYSTGTSTIGDLTIESGGQLTVSGGTLTSDDLTVEGTLILTGGTLNAASLAGSGTIYLNGGTLNIDGTNSFTGEFIATSCGSTITATAGTITYSESTDYIAEGTYYNLETQSDAELCGDVTVSDSLTLGGILTLGDYDITVEGTLLGASASSYINTDSEGYLIRTGDDVDDLAITYPVGSGGYYTPMVISSLTGSGTYSISVQAVSSDMGADNLAKYWSVETGLSSVTATAYFVYDDAEIEGDESNYKVWYRSDSYWKVPGGASITRDSNQINTASGTSRLAGHWTAGENPPSLTWYSYQSGDWDSSSTWTLDPSGTLRINDDDDVPDSVDQVVILNGDEVTLSNDDKTISYLTIEEGGTLDIGETSGHSFSTLDGAGLFRLSTSDLDIPATSGTFFEANGGTVEYYASGITTAEFSDFTFNNLIINMGNTTDRVTCTGDLTVHGNFTVTQGIFRINDNSSTTALDFTFEGNVEVEADGQMRTGTASVFHAMSVAGDFTNEGVVRFTNRTGDVTYAYLTATPDNGVTVTFTGASDNTLTCNDTTDFHRFIVDKGTDQTYVLTVVSSNVDYFRLYGRNNQTATDFDYNDENLDGILKNLWIRNGTLKLEGYIDIPSLTEGGSENFHIPLNGCLWLDGDNVNVDVTWPGTTGNQALVPFGKVRVDAGTLDCQDGGGFIYRGTAEFEINGGYVRASHFRPSSYSEDALTSFTMTGGELDLDGDGEGNQKSTFCLPFENNSFVMSGGTINISYAMTDGAFVVGANNYEVTGGDVNIIINNDNEYLVTSTAPLYNFSVSKTGGSSTEVSIEEITSGGFSNGVFGSITTEQYPLIVQNDLTIDGTNTPTLLMNDADLYVGGDFTIVSGGIYEPGSNTTYFNGAVSQTFANSGTITDGLNNFTLANSATDVTLDGSNTTLTVNGTLTLEEGTTLRDNGNTVYAYGDIENSGVHYHPVSGAGSIQLTGTADQEISGDGNGMFNNLTLNKTGGTVTLSADASFTGNLRLAGAASETVPTRLDIGSFNVYMDTTAAIYSGLTGTASSFDKNCMIMTSGQASDGGITKYFYTNDAFTYPFGFYANSTYYYMPAVLSLTVTPTTYGSVTSRPVSQKHPLAESDNVLSCYWVTESSGFSGLSETAVTHNYYHDADELSDDFVNGTESDYVPAVYQDGSTWEYKGVEDIDAGNNLVVFDENSTFDGEYTAGEEDAFSDSVGILYSVADGDWDDAGTWSSVRGDASTGNTDIPSDSTIAYICDSHTVTASANGAVSAKVYIEEGATLDLSTYTAHDFEQGTGQGTLQIAASDYFPSGDWGKLLQLGGGTVEYYTDGDDIILPLSSDVTAYTLDHYNNLKLTLNDANNITLPNSDLEIYSNATVGGAGTGQCETDNSEAHTITIDSSYIQNDGDFVILNGAVQQINVLGDMNLYAGTFGVAAEGTVVEHGLKLYGNLYNDGVLTLTQGTDGADGHVDAVFTGSENTTFSGSGTNTLYSMEVDKGSSATPVLTVQSPLTTQFDPALTLTNGTFRWDNTGSFNASVASAFPVPETACLSVNQGTLNVVNYATGTSNGLTLNGKLEVLGGTMNIGKVATGTYHNDIEYASSGTPTITIDGGALNVYGQIRRSTSSTQGALTYEQSGGRLNVYGQNADAEQLTRAKFEICNNNSSFSMSGGTIQIYRGSGTTFGDLYLRPEAENISGGTIVVGQDTVETSAQSYTLDASCNLYNLTIVGGSETYTAEATLSVNPLELLGNLTIDTNATLSSGTQNVAVTIAGNFTNNGTYTPNTNTTTFNGSGEQTATFGSATSFYVLKINKASGTLTLAGTAQPSVSNDLYINSGILDDGTRTLTVYGDVTNEATHTSSSTGSISFSGTVDQTIFGDDNGQFGNLEINNASGNVILDADITINGELTFTEGYLYIKDYLLTLGEDASVAGTLTTNQCIVTSGALSDAGVEKVFPGSGSSADFTFPIGVIDKYTPASISLDYSGEGSIVVRPVNAAIPSLTNTTVDELQYYWDVSSTGFSGISNVDHTYYYEETDLSGIAETDDGFVAARYYDYTWFTSDDIPIAVNTTDHSIEVTSASFIDGDYTCGHEDNFGDKLIYYSRNAATDITTGADWSDPNTWAIGGHDGTVAVDTPSGNPMFIAEGHLIHIDDDDLEAYSVCDSGTLDIQTYTGHNLGFVSGNGRIVIQNTSDAQFVFPGGDFTEFLSTGGSTVEYNGSNVLGGSNLPPAIKSYQNLEFTGGEVKYLSNNDVVVKGNLLITESEVDNSTYGSDLTVWGNWTDEYASGFIAGEGTVTFADSLATVVTTNGTEEFYNLAVDKEGEDVTLNGPVVVSNLLTLTSGNVFTDSTNLLTLSSTSTSAVSGGSDTSFVDGPLAKNMTSGSYFTFPVGDNGRFGKIELPSITSETSPATWTVEYVDSDPDAIDTSATLTSPLTSISDNEYWVVSRPASGTSTANVSLRWDDGSYVGITSDATARNYLRVVEYDGSSSWNIRGQSVSASEQTVSTTTEVTGDDYIFTLGLAGITATLTDTVVDDICNNGTTVSIPVTLTGTANWSLTYRVENESTGSYLDFTQNGISAESYTISLMGSDLSAIANEDATTHYVITLLSVSDNSGSSGICTGSTTFSVLYTNVPDITGTFTVGAEEERTFSTDEYTGDTYEWDWSGTSGGTIPEGSSYTKDITMSATAGTYILVVTETTASTGCVATDEQTIIVSELPSPEITPTTANVCLGDVVVYTTPYIEGHGYSWTVSGGSFTADSNAVEVSWDTAGAGYVKVTETNADALSGTDQNNYYVNDSIVTTYAVSSGADTVCTGSYTTITLSGSQTGVTYQLRNQLNDSVIDSKTGTGSSIGFVSDSIEVTGDSTITYYIYAYNSGCTQSLPTPISITFIPLPEITVTESNNDTILCEEASTTLTASVTPSATYTYLWTWSWESDGVTHTETGTSTTSVQDVTMPSLVANESYANNSSLVTYSVTATNTVGCSASQDYEITIYRIPNTGLIQHMDNTLYK